MTKAYAFQEKVIESASRGHKALYLDTGGGKTFTCIRACESELVDATHAVLVAPKTVLPQWKTQQIPQHSERPFTWTDVKSGYEGLIPQDGLAWFGCSYGIFQTGEKGRLFAQRMLMYEAGLQPCICRERLYPAEYEDAAGNPCEKGTPGARLVENEYWKQERVALHPRCNVSSSNLSNELVKLTEDAFADLREKARTTQTFRGPSGQLIRYRITGWVPELQRPYACVLVLDESQAIKNVNSNRWDALFIARGIVNPKRCYILTGTPMTKTPMELWAQYQFLVPGASGYDLDTMRYKSTWKIKEREFWTVKKRIDAVYDKYIARHNAYVANYRDNRYRENLPRYINEHSVQYKLSVNRPSEEQCKGIPIVYPFEGFADMNADLVRAGLNWQLSAEHCHSIHRMWKYMSYDPIFLEHFRDKMAPYTERVLKEEINAAFAEGKELGKIYRVVEAKQSERHVKAQRDVAQGLLQTVNKDGTLSKMSLLTALLQLRQISADYSPDVVSIGQADKHFADWLNAKQMCLKSAKQTLQINPGDSKAIKQIASLEQELSLEGQAIMSNRFRQEASHLPGNKLEKLNPIILPHVQNAFDPRIAEMGRGDRVLIFGTFRDELTRITRHCRDAFGKWHVRKIDGSTDMATRGMITPLFGLPSIVNNAQCFVPPEGYDKVYAFRETKQANQCFVSETQAANLGWLVKGAYLPHGMRNESGTYGELFKLEGKSVVPIILVLNHSISAGLNLQGCACQVWMSRDFSVQNRIQAEDRSHRLGILKSPIIYDIIYDAKIEKRIIESYQSGQELLNTLSSVKRSSVGGLNYNKSDVKRLVEEFFD